MAGSGGDPARGQPAGRWGPASQCPNILRPRTASRPRCCGLVRGSRGAPPRLGDAGAGPPASTRGAAQVTALAFGPVGNLLAVGHANGDVAFWELKRAGWECVKALKGARTKPSLDPALHWTGPAPHAQALLTPPCAGGVARRNRWHASRAIMLYVRAACLAPHYEPPAALSVAARSVSRMPSRARRPPLRDVVQSVVHAAPTHVPARSPGRARMHWRRRAYADAPPPAETHVTPVCAAAFVAGAAAVAVTADTRGRVVLHNVTAYLSLTALLAGARSPRAGRVTGCARFYGLRSRPGTAVRR